jgi:hypothetical protein
MPTKRHCSRPPNRCTGAFPVGDDGATAPILDHLNGVASQRDARGRFVPGHQGGPGRKRRSVEVEYLRSLSDAVSLDAWRQVCETALRQAIEGDDRARAFLEKYLVGDPPPKTLASITADEVAGHNAGEQAVIEAGINGALARDPRSVLYVERMEDALRDTLEDLRAVHGEDDYEAALREWREQSTELAMRRYEEEREGEDDDGEYHD